MKRNSFIDICRMVATAPRGQARLELEKFTLVGAKTTTWPPPALRPETSATTMAHRDERRCLRRYSLPPWPGSR